LLWFGSGLGEGFDYLLFAERDKMLRDGTALGGAAPRSRHALSAKNLAFEQSPLGHPI
jgi:hypothetical protein